MSKTFLESSAAYDANDLTSVVDVGGHWCICAWAWASAVSRDPETMEGIDIDCHRTNGRLRQVFELHIIESRDLVSPSGASYKAKAALDALDRKCPPQSANASGTQHMTRVLNATRLPPSPQLRQSGINSSLSQLRGQGGSAATPSGAKRSHCLLPVIISLVSGFAAAMTT